MTYKKIHRRATLLAATTHSTTATTPTNNPVNGPALNPTGPPLFVTTTTSPAAVPPTTTTTSTTSTTSTSTSTSSSSTSSTSSTSTSTVPTTPPVATPVSSAHVSSNPLALTQSVTEHVTFSSVTTSASPTTTTAASSSSGMGFGSIAGIAVASIVAIGVLTAFIIWLIKRRNKNHDIDEEPFNRQSWLRNSTAIPDDDGPLPSRVRPTPPPNMAERQPTPLYGQQSFGPDPNGFNYATQPSYNAAPGQIFRPNAFGPGGAPATPLPHSPGFGTAYDQQGMNNGGYQELTRGPPMHDYPPSPARGFDPHFDNPHSPSYIVQDSFPTPPHSAGGAAEFDEHGQEINHRSMTPAQHGQVVSVTNSLHDGMETPVQLGFAPAAHAPAAPANGRAPGARPETVYDTEDAYGGI